ncbi:hypothetical protein AXW83_25020 [Bosea sp. PAMC 26642]|nr:hypothetical protein AXW83_25020 [Bosea sp. PAMC 26642]
MVLSLWPGAPSAELKPVSIRPFEPLAKSGRIHCFAPQHHSLAEVKRDNPGLEKTLRALVPPDIIEARNIDDIYAIVSVIDGSGVYIRYSGYRSLANMTVCW